MATVYWVTGLSGAGKTTVAQLLADRLRSHGRPALLLDGDAVRECLPPVSDPTRGHDPMVRQQLAMSYGRLCRMVTRQGIDAVCATISMFETVRRWNRQNIDVYREIYLNVPMPELQRRDPKGLYAKAKRGELHDIVGLDLPAELPSTPDLVIDNFGSTSPADAVELIWKTYMTRHADSVLEGEEV